MASSPPLAIPPDVLARTAKWMVDFREYWSDEAPSQIHTGAIGRGGTPEWHPDFARWLGIDYYGAQSDRSWRENPEVRLRTTRAFRKLRKKAVREYETCYRIIILGDSFENTMAWLNERSIRNGKDDRYGMREVVLLVVSGVEKMVGWW